MTSLDEYRQTLKDVQKSIDKQSLDIEISHVIASHLFKKIKEVEKLLPKEVKNAKPVETFVNTA